MFKRLFHYLLIAICISASSAALASDMAREKRMADSIKNSLVIGEIVMLQANGDEFLTLINNEEPGKIRGSVIILHGMGSNPNAPQIIQPLRSQLAELDWITASIQLPIAAKDASIKDNLALIKQSAPRIQAALDYMRNNYKDTPCVLIAHSLGAIMAVDFLASQKKLPCDALVLIGLPTLPSDLPEANAIESLKKISIPTLDIYGSQDLDSVKKLAPIRRVTLKKNNALNRQIEMSGADHVFTGLNSALTLSIHNWLSRVFQTPNE